MEQPLSQKEYSSITYRLSNSYQIYHPNLLDYKLSTVMDHPDLQTAFIENPEPTSEFGTKALGEPPACSGAPAIRNAIYNATGVALRKLPMNPHNLFAAFTEAGLIRDEWQEG